MTKLQFAVLAKHCGFTTRDFKAVSEKYRKLIPEYVKDCAPLHQFAA